MAVTRNEFINTSPTAENIQALVSASMVIGLTVSTTDCKLNNYQNSLSQLNTITVDGLNNNNPILITSITPKPEYYYYEIVPFPIVSSFNGNECLETNFTPFLEAIGFDNSDFNVLFNNATSSRASSYLQDVDRKRDAIKPTNIENILDDTALKATVPDSYYSSYAHTLGRYIGSKTSVLDYGTSPIIGATTFEAAQYALTQQDSSICSQTVDEIKVNQYLFSDNYNSGSTGTEPKLSLVYILKDASNYTITAEQTSSTFYTNNIGSSFNLWELEPGDILQFGIIRSESSSNKFEQVKVSSVTFTTSSLGNLESATVNYRRHHNRSYFRTLPNYAMLGYSASLSTVKSIARVEGSQIFDTDGNQLYNLASKKLLVSKTKDIFVTDVSGSIVHLTSNCNL